MADPLNLKIAENLVNGKNPQQSNLDNQQAIAERMAIFDQAAKTYPIINRFGIQGTAGLSGNGGYLEFWPPDEIGTQSAPRPESLPMDQPGVEIYRADTKPQDVLADVASHWLVNKDPVIQSYFQDFVNSMTPNQQGILDEQYKWAQENMGETRPFDVWAEASGLPGYFRGYAFQQWPAEFNTQAYTPEQMQQFDAMMRYLTSAPRQ